MLLVPPMFPETQLPWRCLEVADMGEHAAAPVVASVADRLSRAVAVPVIKMEAHQVALIPCRLAVVTPGRTARSVAAAAAFPAGSL